MPRVRERATSFAGVPKKTQYFLIVAVTITGTMNSFSSRIRAQAFGNSNYAVAVYNAIVQAAVYWVGYGFLRAAGKIPPGQLSALCRCDGWHWSELGLVKYLVVAAMSDIANEITGFTAEPLMPS